jgi:MoxR-like ATPase
MILSSLYNIIMEQNRESPEVLAAAELLESCRREMAKRIVGQGEMIDGLLMALIAGGHILLEGVPGLAKTLAVKSLADMTGLLFKRVQFTPDLLPADLTGTLVWEQASGTFSVRRGPVFANVILADEINRAPAKVQSALLEAMEERQVTIGERSYALPEPFFVLATQNPIEHEGTYALPEAELDRFLLKLLVRYPSPDEEIQILNSVAPFSGRSPGFPNSERGGASPGKYGALISVAPEPVLDASALESLRAAADSVYIDQGVIRYIVSIVSATRPREGSRPSDAGGKAGREGLYRYISFGASPRAAIALYRCARIRALFEGKSFVSPDEVKAAALPVLRHRIVLSYEAEADGLEQDAVISRLLSFVPVP